MEEKILDIKVTNTSYEDLEEKINNDLKNNKKIFVVAINPEKILKAKKDEYLKQIINSADYNIADGIGIVYASKILKGNITQRITGIDLFEKICNLSNKRNYRIFLYGASEENIIKAREKLVDMYPNINIVGIQNGYENNEKKIIKKINDCNANVLFVGLGTPKQEYWIYQNMNKINANIFMGVGGTFDVISGNINRAPIFIRKCGLECLYRLFKEPKRIFRQIKLFKYVFLVIKSKIVENSK